MAQILPMGRLRLSPFRRMSDPLEAKMWWLSTTLRGDQPEELRREADALMDHIILDEMKVLALTIDAPPDGFSGDRLWEPEERWRRGWGRARMWQQYAEDHHGLCLAFAYEDGIRHFAEAVEALGQQAMHGPVSYRVPGYQVPGTRAGVERLVPLDLTPILSGASLAELVEDRVSTLENEAFFTKTTDWQAEYEYRFVVRTRRGQSSSSSSPYAGFSKRSVSGPGPVR